MNLDKSDEEFGTEENIKCYKQNMFSKDKTQVNTHKIPGNVTPTQVKACRVS